MFNAINEAVTSFSLWRPGFDSKTVHVGLLVSKSGTEIIFSLCTLVLSCHLQEQVRRKVPCFISTKVMLTAVCVTLVC